MKTTKLSTSIAALCAFALFGTSNADAKNWFKKRVVEAKNIGKKIEKGVAHLGDEAEKLGKQAEKGVAHLGDEAEKLGKQAEKGVAHLGDELVKIGKDMGSEAKKFYEEVKNHPEPYLIAAIVIAAATGSPIIIAVPAA